PVRGLVARHRERVARVRARAVPARRPRGRRESARERRAQEHRSRVAPRGALLARRDALATRPHRAGGLAVPPGRAGRAAPGLGRVGAARKRLDGAAPARSRPRARHVQHAPGGAHAVAAGRVGSSRPRAVALRARPLGRGGQGVDAAGSAQRAAGDRARRSVLAWRHPRADRPRRARRDDAAPVHAGRAWVLMGKGEARRAQGDRDEARTKLELAQKVAGGTPAGRQAAVRQARVDFEIREYGQAVTDLTPVLNARPAPDLLLPALLLQGEAAYQAGDFMAAGAALRRMLVEFPTDAQAPLARTALAWTYLKQGRKGDARRELLEAVRAKPDDPRAPDTLLIASELALEADDLTAGREMV